MKVAFITPTAHLRTHGNFTDYHMVLPEQLTTFSDNAYYDFYKSVANGYKILDNGAAEGNHLHPVDLINLALEMQVNEIVVPDVMGDYTSTMQKAVDFSHIARRAPLHLKFMGVLQGKTLDQLERLLQFYLEQRWIKTIAFPRCLQETWHPYIRAEFAFTLSRVIKDAGKEIHCLGATSYPYEAYKLGKMGIIRGIDTCVPAELARGGHELHVSSTYYGRESDFFQWHAPRTEDEWLLNKNYQTYLTWAETTPEPRPEPGGSIHSPTAPTVPGTAGQDSRMPLVHRKPTSSS